MKTIIAAVANNGAIGKDNRLLWHIPEDLQRYKERTLDNICIVGLNTYYSLPAVALMGRIHIVVVGEQHRIYKKINRAKVIFVEKLEDAVELAENIKKEWQEIFFIGGAMLYKSAIEYADAVELTWVDAEPEADTFFPLKDLKGFYLSEEGETQNSEEGLSYKVNKYLRKQDGKN